MNTRKLITIGFISLFFASCNSDNDDGPNVPTIKGGEGNILVVTTLYNPDGQSGSSYLQLLPSFSGSSVDNANAIPLDFASSTAVIGNEIFVFPTFGKDATDEIRKYVYEKGHLRKDKALPTPPFSFPNNMVSVSSEKVYVPMYVLGKVWVINPKTMQKTGEIDLSMYAHNDASPDPSYGYIRDGKYFLPLNQLDPQWMPYNDYLQVDVAIINTQTDQVEKVISEKQSNMSFPTRPMLKNMIFIDENNDLYIACSGYFGFNPNHKESGFVCIPAGQTEFDTTKSWDISNTIIEGTSYKAATIFNTQYIENGKLAALVGIAELATDNPYTNKNSMPVIIDLKNKTIKRIEEIPVSSGHGLFIGKQNNLIVFGIDGANKVGFFTYNPANGEVKQVLTTKGAPYFMHTFN